MKAIIIGATSGIGRKVAENLLERGWTLGLCGRRIEKLAEIKQKYGQERVHISAMDVTEPESLGALDMLIGQIGSPDLLLYVSGIGYHNMELDEGKEIATVRTNCEGMVRITSHFLNYVRSHLKDYSSTKKAHIAVITSIAGTAGLGAAPAYSATKTMESCYISALAQLSRMEDIPVRFTDIRPGFVKTALLDPDRRYPMEMALDDAAKHVLKAIDKKKRVYIFDWRYRLLVFFWRLIPLGIWERIKFVRN